ncbi:MAG: DUF4145 domain-containing protein [Pseudomonadota bacterium]|jgi:hypothetical protein
MALKQVHPVLGGKSFSCPTCGALAHQSWIRLFAQGYSDADRPQVPASNIVDLINDDRTYNADMKRDLLRYFKQRLSRKPFFETQDQSVYLSDRLDNCWVSRCFSCKGLAIWIYDQVIFPAASFAVDPNEDMDDEIKLDFEEAAKIITTSPRGAAALLRLCIQKLCMQLGLPGKNINDDISTLVKRGLEPQIQQALDIVRVIGNDAVHPGQIDLKDNREIAVKLFTLVNIIAEAMISRPKQIQELYGNLPPAKLEQIERRDAPKQIEPPAKPDS